MEIQHIMNFIAALKGRTKLVVLLLLSFGLAFVYNACSQNRFGLTEEAEMQLLSQSAVLTINNGASYTKDAAGNVTLNIRNSAATEMYITNDSSCSRGGSWESVQSSRTWTLAQLNGPARVYGGFKGQSGAVICVQANIIHDSLAPQIQIKNTPALYNNRSNINFGIDATDGGSGLAQVLCAADGSLNASGCQNGFAAPAVGSTLKEGPHSVTVTSTDKAGNTSLPIEVKWVSDFTAPVIKINSGPAALTASLETQFVFSATDNLSPLAGYICSVDGVVVQTCVSPVSFTLAKEGAHVFVVQAQDNAGNLSTPLQTNWQVDLRVPTVKITSAPPAFDLRSSVSIPFTGFDARGKDLISYQCAKDGGSYVNCTSPFNVVGLREGPHVVSVKGTDSLGLVSAATSVQWISDFTAPVIRVVAAPSGRVAQTSANFVFTVSDNQGSGITSTCALDGEAPIACNSGVFPVKDLKEKSHTLIIAAKDAAGNLAAPVSISWIVDVTLPVVEITSMPPQYTNQKTAAFTFAAKDFDGGTITQLNCSLDGKPATLCNSTTSYANLTEGLHTLNVRAVDNAGNISNPGASYSWNIRLTGPQITFQKVPDNPSNSLNPSVLQYTVTDSFFPTDKLTITCGLNGASASCPATQNLIFQILPAGTNTYTVTAKDPAGNSTTQTITWVVQKAVRFPSSDNIAAIAYEDLYPSPGDTDFNDFVSNFKITQMINSLNQITKIIIDFYPRAKSSGYIQALVVVLDGKRDEPTNNHVVTAPLFNGDAQSIKLSRYDGSGNLQSVTNYNKTTDVVVFQNTQTIFGGANGTPKNGYLSEPYIPTTQAARLEIVLSSPASNPYDVVKGMDMSKFRFVLHAESGADIDLTEVVPTSIDVNGFPFAIVIPTNWQWPIEGMPIETAYPQFAAYRNYLLQKSKNPNIVPSEQALNWYKYPTGTSGVLYPLPPNPKLLPEPN